MLYNNTSSYNALLKPQKIWHTLLTSLIWKDPET